MRNLARTSALLLAFAAAACSAGDTDLLESDESDDRLSDYEWTWDMTKEIEVAAMSTDSSITVSLSDGVATIQGPVFEADIPEDGTMQLSVSSRGLDSLTDDLQFMLMVKDARGNWSPKEWTHEYEIDGVPSVSKISTFDSLTYSPADDSLVAVNSIVGEFTKENAALRGATSFGIFVVPEEVSLLGFDVAAIDGGYDFTVEADCNGKPCDRDPFRQN